MTIGIDLGDVWSHCRTLNQEGEVVDRGRFRTSPKAVEKWFTDFPPARVADEFGNQADRGVVEARERRKEHAQERPANERRQQVPQAITFAR